VKTSLWTARIVVFLTAFALGAATGALEPGRVDADLLQERVVELLVQVGRQPLP
jgi:hypothetical protein